jgi:hypothetical protein
MSIVSAQLDTMAVPRRRGLRPIAVQYKKNDTEEAEPPNFAIPPQVPTFNLSHRYYKPVDTPIAKLSMGFVPMLEAQLNRPEASARFWADTRFDVPKLDEESEVPFPVKAYDFSGVAKYPDVAPVYPYEKGISGVGRPIKFDDIAEPVGAVFRKASKHTRL